MQNIQLEAILLRRWKAECHQIRPLDPNGLAAGKVQGILQLREIIVIINNDDNSRRCPLKSEHIRTQPRNIIDVILS